MLSMPFNFKRHFNLTSENVIHMGDHSPGRQAPGRKLTTIQPDQRTQQPVTHKTLTTMGLYTGLSVNGQLVIYKKRK